VINELDHTRHVFVVSGFIPEEDCEKLQKLCEHAVPCYIEFNDVDEKDAPVKLKNNKFAEPAQSIVTMYSSPSHRDIDPTPILAFFFYFFFGMMFSDAGYGLIMVTAIGIVLKAFKPDTQMRNNLKLFQYCGVSTIIWGLIFGSIFGDAPVVFYNLFTGANLTMAELLPWPTLDPQKDALTLMMVSIAFGLVHILVGMGCKFYICWKEKDYAAALFDTGFWMLMLIGFAVLAIGIVTTPVCIYIGAGIAIACAVGLILTQGRSKKGFIGKLIGGIASLYDITSYISDLLSYSRLLALGLTTGVMAQVFNMLASMFGTNPLGIIFMVIVFVFGHAITIGLNALGSYVHTMRLQYVEMFSKFYEGGGQPFEPFSLNSKYIKISEDEKK
jgi:V/A-type H+-transporting ATPase subunit I